MKKVFIQWLPIGITILILCGFINVAVQQMTRQMLNDPQIQMAEDAQNALLSGKAPTDIVPRGELFDVEKSLKPFIAVYDSAGIPLESSATVGNLPPKPPIGVFEYAQKTGKNWVTWQPNSTTRIALVVMPVGNSSGYFVASGRNMRVVESHISTLNLLTLLALFSAWILSFVFLSLSL